MNFYLYNMDCIQGAKEHIEDGAVDLVIADPPYNLKFGGTTQTKTKRPRFKIIANDDLTTREYQRFTLQWIRQAYRILSYGKHIYVFIDWRMVPYMALWMRKVGFEIKNIIVWDKEHMGMGWQYRFQHELIIFAVKGKKKVRRINTRSTTDIWRIPRISGNKTIHPTEKPVSMMEKIIKNSSEEEEHVVDFFSGSGPVTEAAVKLNRKITAFEIDQGYYEMTLNRVKHLQ
ncbi:DNA-methyltransferase [Chengkuizengella marina]|uniref:Methyltransferase n=1 Tax=Chengkuizengella marina TaxID=2507566 RepID=A0A6N9Q2T6_9BACL|nr:site-specific DNA-methyltransferase [Chengkuizengella marina]NBI29102.1 site-specific DNA-methyltransferase [Chengkuizengella marina]